MANYTQRPRRISNVRVVNRNYPFFIRFIRNLYPGRVIRLPKW